jgi:DNA adenine methylase
LRYSIPHPIPYQGSKRRLATAILSQIPATQFQRLIEPFAGSAAITLAAAQKGIFRSYVIGDVLEPLVALWQSIIHDPAPIASQYEEMWLRERGNPIHEYYEIRAEFNRDRDPAKLLYLLARCVKNAVRFNPRGEFNQSPDKRRTGTNPETMKSELYAAHAILRGNCHVVSGDFLTLFETAKEGDFFYLDPPYQGTTEGRDQRYISGVSRTRIIEALNVLNEKNIPFVLSYDGYCGGQEYGEPLPESIAHRILLDVGRSSQATLNGRKHTTTESLYISRVVDRAIDKTHISLGEFLPQATLFG